MSYRDMLNNRESYCTFDKKEESESFKNFLSNNNISFEEIILENKNIRILITTPLKEDIHSSWLLAMQRQERNLKNFNV